VIETDKVERVASIDLAITRAGGIVAFSKAVGVTHQAVYAWKRRGWAPADKALVMEAVFDVPRARTMEPRLAALVATPPSTAADLL